jgi:uncharacterized membrane protein YhhN
MFLESSLLFWVLSTLILVSSFFHLKAEYKPDTKQVYIFKSTTVLLIILLASLLDDFSSAYQWLIVAGLVFSLGGDVLLISPDRFVAGLVSFLIAHLFYIAAFVIGNPAEHVVYFYSMLPFVVFAGLILYFIYKGLGSLKTPVLFYLLVIVVMGWQSLNQYWFNSNIFSLAALIGASLFMLSDSLIAVDKFRGELKYNRTMIMTTYYVGQYLIALSVAGAISIQ